MTACLRVPRPSEIERNKRKERAKKKSAGKKKTMAEVKWKRLSKKSKADANDSDFDPDSAG
jgi:hypothetical protein